jgi:hypothetical protein
MDGGGQSARTTEDERKRRWDPMLEVLIAVALGLAAIVAAGAAYLNERQDHESIVQFDRALALSIEASAHLSLASQSQIDDSAVFTQYLTSKVTDPRAALAIRSHVMSPRLLKEVTWWESAPQTGPTPFTTANPYFEQGELTEAQASSAMAKAAADGGKGDQASADRYTLVVLIISSALFLYGIAGVTRRFTIRVGALGAGAAIFLAAVGILIAEAL